jgi:hypothetical protein
MTAHDNYDAGGNNFTANNPTPNKYFNKFTYDRNGNITFQARYDEFQQVIDDLKYGYKKNTVGRVVQNRLYHVNDGVSPVAYADDIDDQGGGFDPLSSTINASYNYAMMRLVIWCGISRNLSEALPGRSQAK